MAKIIVISDIHYSINDRPDVYEGEKISKKLTDQLSVDTYDILFSALEGEKEPADAIIFCGDYIIGKDSMADKKKALEAFVAFLDRIERSSKVIKGDDIKSRIFIVPGNHDITREAEDIYEEFQIRLSRYCTPFSSEIDYPNRPTFILDDLKLIIDCETTEDASSTLDAEVEEIINIVKDAAVSEETRERLLKNLNSRKTLDIPTVSAETSTRFVNSSNNLFRDDKYKDYLKILVTHHALISGIEMGKPVKSYNSTIGGFDFMRSAMEYGYSLFIHGHIHQRTCVEIRDCIQENTPSAIQLGIPNLQRDKTENGIVVIDTDNTEDSEWPFLIVFKTLSSLTRGFKQTGVIDRRISKTIQKGDSMNILVDREIVDLINEGKVIKNGDRDRVEAASYDCSLGYMYKRAQKGKRDWESIKADSLEASGGAAEIIVEPQETVLIYTYEEFDVPDDMIMHASPISSWLRKGLRTELSLFVDPGFKGQFCFPVVNESDEPISISSREPIMSIELIRLSQKCDKNWTGRHEEKMKKRKMWED